MVQAYEMTEVDQTVADLNLEDGELGSNDEEEDQELKKSPGKSDEVSESKPAMTSDDSEENNVENVDDNETVAKKDGGHPRSERRREHRHRHKRSHHRHKSPNGKRSKRSRHSETKSDNDELVADEGNGFDGERLYNNRSPTSSFKSKLAEFENRLDGFDDNNIFRDEEVGRRRDRDGDRGHDHLRLAEFDNHQHHHQRAPRFNRPCPKFIIGRCHRSDEDCYYIHEGLQPDTMELCKFYVLNRCRKQEQCNYLHKGFPCKWYHTGFRCQKTATTCKFSHDPLTDETRDLLIRHLETAPREVMGDFPNLSRDEGYLAVMRQECRHMMYDRHPVDNNINMDGYIKPPPLPRGGGGGIGRSGHQDRQALPRFGGPGSAARAAMVQTPRLRGSNSVRGPASYARPPFRHNARPMAPYRPMMMIPRSSGPPPTADYPPYHHRGRAGPPHMIHSPYDQRNNHHHHHEARMMMDKELSGHNGDYEHEQSENGAQTAAAAAEAAEAAAVEAAECAAIDEIDKLVPDDVLDWADLKSEVDKKEKSGGGEHHPAVLVPFILRALVRPRIDYTSIVRLKRPAVDDMQRDPRLVPYVDIREALVDQSQARVDPRKRDPRRR